MLKKTIVKYSPKLVDQICDLMAEKLMTPKDVCEKIPNMPKVQTVYKWMQRYPGVRTKIHNAYYTLMAATFDAYLYKLRQPVESLDSICAKIGIDRKQLAEHRQVALQYLRETQKQKADELRGMQFLLGKIIPRYMPEFAEKTTVEHKGNVNQTIVIKLASWKTEVDQVSPALSYQMSSKNSLQLPDNCNINT